MRPSIVVVKKDGERGGEERERETVFITDGGKKKRVRYLVRLMNAVVR